MKKLLFIIVLLSICSISIAEEFSITPEERLPIIKVKISSLRFLNFEDTAEVSVQYITEDGEVVKSDNVYFRDTKELTEFTDFVKGLKIDKVFLKDVVKNKIEDKKINEISTGT